MKVDFNELFKKRWSLEWTFDKKSNSVKDEMVDAAISEGNNEFAVILCIEWLKFVKCEFKCECMFPNLRNYFVTGIFNLWKWNDRNEKKETYKPFETDYREYSLITFSKEKPKRIRTCIAYEELDKSNIGWTKTVRLRKTYYKELESYINTSKISDSLRHLVHKIEYSDYREEVFDARYYSDRFLKLSNAISEAKKKHTFVPLKDLVEIIDWRKTIDWNKRKEDYTIWYKALDSKLQKYLYPLNEKRLEEIRNLHPLKKGDIIFSLDGSVYLFAEDSKIAVSDSGHTVVLRLKSTRVTPEYLFLYMNSGLDYFKDINYLTKTVVSQDTNLFYFINWAWSDLENIPVFIPKTDIPMALDKNATQKYIDIFNQNYRPYLVAEKELEVVLDEFVQEEMKGNCLVSDSDANKRVIELMREVHKAISCQIYNGAVILMGSILEAFFTGWCGDFEREDYFRDPVSSVFVHGKEKDLDLTFRDAIDNVLKRLKNTKRKKEIYEKIEKIRAMRDEIHTRVYLKHGTKMTKSICESALKDLEEIIRLRYYNFQMDSFMKTIAIE